MSETSSARQKDGRSDLTAGIVKRVVQLGIQALLLAAVLFVSSGRLDWVWAWILSRRLCPRHNHQWHHPLPKESGSDCRTCGGKGRYQGMGQGADHRLRSAGRCRSPVGRRARHALRMVATHAAGRPLEWAGVVRIGLCFRKLGNGRERLLCVYCTHPGRTGGTRFAQQDRTSTFAMQATVAGR